MRALVLATIRIYQRWISPYKGFCCAYRAHTGRAGCSALGWRAVRRYGVIAGIAVLRQRMALCGVAHRRHGGAGRRVLPGQRGDCDVGCCVPDLDCDLPCGKGASGVCRVAECCNIGGCDWPRRDRRKPRRGEHDVHLPPRREPRREGQVRERPAAAGAADENRCRTEQPQ